MPARWLSAAYGGRRRGSDLTACGFRRQRSHAVNSILRLMTRFTRKFGEVKSPAFTRLLRQKNPSVFEPRPDSLRQSRRMVVQTGWRAKVRPVTLDQATISCNTAFGAVAWFESELLEFDRLQLLLRNAGVASEVERGLGDLGDPWCVVCCAKSGEVLAHFARIDGRYVTDWPGLSRAVRTVQLGAAIERFLQTALRIQSRSDHSTKAL
jgi:hypothetical protein